MSKLTVQQLVMAGAHFGHLTSRWNPKMRPYIFMEKNGIYIIDLNKTLKLLGVALTAAGKIAANGEQILYVGTKKQARDLMRDEAARAGMPYVNERWLGGMLTNFKTIRQSVKRLHELTELTESGGGDFTKKEVLKLARERDKLERALGGIKHMESLPDAVFIIDVGHEEIAVKEARKLGIAVIAIVDTNCSPASVDYPIPGNDDAMRAIQLYAAGIADAVLEGKASIPDVPTGDDEFVELDEEGRPKVASTKPKAKRATTKKKARVTKKAAPKKPAAAAAEEAASGEAAPAAAAADEAASGEAAPAAAAAEETAAGEAAPAAETADAGDETAGTGEADADAHTAAPPAEASEAGDEAAPGTAPQVAADDSKDAGPDESEEAKQ